MMVRMFIYQNTDLLFGHFTKEIVNESWVVVVFIFINQINPLQLFRFQISIYCLYLKLV